MFMVHAFGTIYVNLTKAIHRYKFNSVYFINQSLGFYSDIQIA